jgi:hypothetical protein
MPNTLLCNPTVFEIITQKGANALETLRYAEADFSCLVYSLCLHYWEMKLSSASLPKDYRMK